MRKSEQGGHIIIFTLVFLAVILVASVSLLSYTTLNLRGARTAYWDSQALNLAEAGIDKAIYEINQNGNYSGESNASLSTGVYSVSVSTIDVNKKQIIATGMVPDASGSRAQKTVQVTATINTSDVSFNSGVQVGEGGLQMSNGSKVIGNVFANGSITGSGIVTGDVIVAAGASLTANQQATGTNADFSFARTSAARDAAQSFAVSTTTQITKIGVYLKKTGTPNDLTVRIVSDNGGSPSQNVLSSVSLPASLVTSSYGFIERNLTTAPTLSAGATYWIVLSNGTYSSSKYYTWGIDSTDSYTSGLGKYGPNWNTASPAWANAGGDLAFEVFVGGVVNKIDGVTVGGSVHANTINNCDITKDAYYQAITSSTVGGNSYPNTPAPSPENMPISEAQIQEWKDTATSGGVISGNHTILSSETLGPAKINGDLTLTNGATLELTGPLWVTGNVNILNNSTVRIGTSLGNSGTVLLSDGLVNISNNSTIAGNGNAASFPLIMTTSSNGSAMSIQNNSAGAIYYAPYGYINVSNNAGGNQITAYGIIMNNNSTVTYTSGLQNANFANGPGGSWQFLPGSYSISQ